MMLSLLGCSSGDYKKAVSLTEAGDWRSAREIFVSLGDYSDAAEQVRLCDYRIALEEMAAGEYDAVIELLEAAG